MPATSPSVRSSASMAKPFLSQYLMYMRSSIAAQSCASVPPEPAWMSTKQLLGSSGLENMRRNSSAATSLSRRDDSRPISSRVASSASARAMSNSSFASARPLPTRPSVPTTASSAFFSLPSACARCGLSHSFGSSSSRFSAARRLCFASKSKIPPQLDRPGQQVGERGGDLVFEKRARVGRRHELAVDLGVDAAVLKDLSVRHLDFERAGLFVVADRAYLR